MNKRIEALIDFAAEIDSWEEKTIPEYMADTIADRSWSEDGEIRLQVVA